MVAPELQLLNESIKKMLICINDSNSTKTGTIFKEEKSDPADGGEVRPLPQRVPEASQLSPEASRSGRLGHHWLAMLNMSEGWSGSGKKERVAQEVQLSAQSSAVNRAALTRCLEAARRSQSRRTSCRVQRPESLLSTKAPGV